jgi:hypothetical protein
MSVAAVAARTTIRLDLGFRLALIASSWNLRLTALLAYSFSQRDSAAGR